MAMRSWFTAPADAAGSEQSSKLYQNVQEIKDKMSRQAGGAGGFGGGLGHVQVWEERQQSVGSSGRAASLLWKAPGQCLSSHASLWQAIVCNVTHKDSSSFLGTIKRNFQVQPLRLFFLHLFFPFFWKKNRRSK